MKYCSTLKMISDINTKSLPPAIFTRLREFLTGYGVLKYEGNALAYVCMLHDELTSSIDDNTRVIGMYHIVNDSEASEDEETKNEEAADMNMVSGSDYDSDEPNDDLFDADEWSGAQVQILNELFAEGIPEDW